MEKYKLEIFIPKTHLKQLQATLQKVDAGHIGNYDSCLPPPCGGFFALISPVEAEFRNESLPMTGS